MHPMVYAEFRTILAQMAPRGRCLEIGALPNTDSLLNLDVLAGCERIGINPLRFGKSRDFEVLEGTGHDLSRFPDGSFDLVLSNATLEHDPQFWRTLAEIRRVLRTGGMAVIGVPGYTPGRTRVGWFLRPFSRDTFNNTTLTFRFHAAPDDYYRFSPRAVEKVFFEGFEDVRVRSIMMPPRIIGMGRRAAA